MQLNSRPSSKTSAGKRRLSRTYGRRGQSLVETAVGIMVLIPLGLFSFDLTIVLMANQTNKEIAENAARAASNQLGVAKATQAAIGAINKAAKSANITNITLLDLNYNIGTGNVSVTTEVDVRVPVSFPGMSQMNLRYTATQPIVATPAPL
jgi:Flp pilus assembly protein TadG